MTTQSNAISTSKQATTASDELRDLVAAMPIVIFAKAISAALKQRTQRTGHLSRKTSAI